MPATPIGFTLALSLPSGDPLWLAEFARGLDAMALDCSLRLIGGDTTRGPLSLTVTVFGRVPSGQALVRSGAQVGDLLCVGGVLGGICLILALYALQLLPVNYAGVALILLGIAFMVAEGFLPSFGVLGIGGGAAFVAGAVILIDTEVPGFGIPLSLIVPLGIVSALLVFAIVAMALKARRQRLVGGDSELIGSLALVDSVPPQNPHSGWVHLQGENWQVRSAMPLQVGQQVRVIARQGLHLEVAAQPSTNREELNHGL